MANYGDPGVHSGDQTVPNPVLFEDGTWRLYGHDEDEYSTIAHKCPKWGDCPNEWWWYWGKDACGKCDDEIPESIMAVYTLHNFDRMSGISY